MKIDQDQLYFLYMEKVEEICEINEFKTHFTPKEIIVYISSILETHPELITN